MSGTFFITVVHNVEPIYVRPRASLSEDGVAVLRTLKRSPIHRVPTALFANRSR